MNQTPASTFLQVSPTLLKRELVRALAAFGIYLVLYLLWSWCGAAEAYSAVIRLIAVRLDTATRHFPTEAPLHEGRMGFYDGLVVLAIAWATASRGMWPAQRALRCLAQILAIATAHIAALVLHTRVGIAREMWEGERIMLLLPRERQMTIWLKYFIYEFGLQMAPFMIVGLWVYWNISASTAACPPVRRPMPRTAWALGSIAAVLIVSASAWWTARRENVPRHIDAHIWFAERSLRASRWTLAEDQFRAAVAGGCADGRAFLNIAALRRRQGDHDGAIAILEQGLKVVTDTPLRETMTQAIAASRREGSRGPSENP